MSRIQIYLKSIECLRLQEHYDDELYCYVFSMNEKGEMIAEKRFPESGIWKFHHGERMEVNQLVYTHESGSISFLNFLFLEEDVPVFARGFAEKVRDWVKHGLPELVDDCLGSILLAISADNRLEWKASLNTVEFQNSAIQSMRPFVIINPGKYQYSLVFEVKALD